MIKELKKYIQEFEFKDKRLLCLGLLIKAIKRIRRILSKINQIIAKGL